MGTTEILEQKYLNAFIEVRIKTNLYSLPKDDQKPHSQHDEGN